jgi:hypothetical protein
VKLGVLLLAVGVILDFATIRHRPIIFERFYIWWCKLSSLNLKEAGTRGVMWFTNMVDRVFGREVFSVRSIGGAILFVWVLTITLTVVVIGRAKIGLVGTVISALIIGPLVLIPGFINFQGSRLLLRALQRRIRFPRVLLFGLVSGVLVEATASFCYACLGAVGALLVKISFDHHLALVDAVPVSGLLILLALGLVLAYLPIAILPGLCCLAAWITFVLVYGSSKLATWIQYFLKERVEQKWEAPFTIVSGVCAAFITMVGLLWNLMDPAAITTTAAKAQAIVSSTAIRQGASGGTYVLIRFSPYKRELALYYQEWAKRIILFGTSGLPTPEQFKAILIDHLPKLESQWRNAQEHADKPRASSGPPR